MVIEPAPALCPHCSLPRVDGPECPRCGVIYARAHSPSAHPPGPRPMSVPNPPPDAPPPAADVPETELAAEPGVDSFEARLRAFAIPAALAVASLLVRTSLGQFLVRTFLSMWIHELGHATTAWIGGFNAFPGPWRTSIGDERSVVIIIMLFAVALWMFRMGWLSRNRRWTAAGSALVLAQLVGLMLRPATVQALITFGGDAGCLVWGTALMCIFYVGEEHPLRTRGLRWGFVAIGAAAFVDVFHTWWGARTDTDLVPYGEIEGVGLSDPAKLVEVYGWTLNQVISRYVTLGCACALVLAVVYGVALARARGKPDINVTRGRSKSIS